MMDIIHHKDMTYYTNRTAICQVRVHADFSLLTYRKGCLECITSFPLLSQE